MARILVDTSAVYALLDRDDRRHEAATTTLRGLKRDRVVPLLTNFLLAECHALCLSRLGHEVARRWLLGNVWPVERVTVEDEGRATGIVGHYADKSFSYTDATSFAVMERLGIRKAFAFDGHFEQYGFQRVGPS